MANYTQADRPLAVTTPLGTDVLLLTGFTGAESISELFSFQLEMLAEADRDIAFDGIVGQSVTVELRLLSDDRRYFNGIVKRFSQGRRGDRFIHYRAEMVPKIWLLTRKVRSRIFQHITVPDILHEVLSGFDVTYEILGNYYQRDYCVQYRESDFNFVSRLMEEEGIYYFFKHEQNSHKMVVTDVPTQHPSVPVQDSVIYRHMVGGGMGEEIWITSWDKSQELRSGAYTLWDHCFELPTNHLEAREKTVDAVKVGTATHKLCLAGNDKLEIYDFPGGYAQRFDGIDRSGGPRPQDLKDIFKDSERTARIRMEQEEVSTLTMLGTSNCGHFTAGHKFKLEQHFDADDQYVLVRVEHDAELPDGYETDGESPYRYENHFQCKPVSLPYRPQRVTPKPVIAGIQTATVVGPQGEELFCDKYGRVKVQFHWDREGKQNGDSSCWLRVAQVWAGSGWGAFFWPRIGHEVVVTFEEGDPDQPMIIGNVYNAQNMPPYPLPSQNNLCGIKSMSHRGKSSENFNGVIFNDKKDHEHLALHSEHNMSFNSEYDKMIHAGRHKGERVSGASVFTVGGLPFGGGSGGGGHFDAGDPMPHPKPLAVLGLNSQWTYGENLQVAFGLNHQLAFGSNLQICVSPLFGFGAGDPAVWLAPQETGVLGSGAGGNMQLTFGTNTQFVWGQSFQINLGPPPINLTINEGDHPTTEYLCFLLYIAVVVWGLLYGIKSGPEDDVARAAITVVFQILIDGLLVGIMLSEMIYKKADKKIEDALRPLFRADKPEMDPDAQHISDFVTINLLYLGIISVPISATIAEAV